MEIRSGVVFSEEVDRFELPLAEQTRVLRRVRVLKLAPWFDSRHKGRRVLRRLESKETVQEQTDSHEGSACESEGRGVQSDHARRSRGEKYDWSGRRSGSRRSMGGSRRRRRRLGRDGRQKRVGCKLRLLRVPLGDAACNLQRTIETGQVSTSVCGASERTRSLTARRTFRLLEIGGILISPLAAIRDAAEGGRPNQQSPVCFDHRGRRRPTFSSGCVRCLLFVLVVFDRAEDGLDGWRLADQTGTSCQRVGLSAGPGRARSRSYASLSPAWRQP